jgi:hypothetical protein
MFHTPFRFGYFGLCNIIILTRGHFRKCAILILLLLLQELDSHGDLPQTVLGDVAGRYSKGARRLTCVELRDMTKTSQVEMFGGFNATADEKHIRYAALQRCSVLRCDVEFVKFFKDAVLAAIEKLAQIVGEVIVRGIPRRRNEGGGKCGRVLQFAKNIPQMLNDLGFVACVHLPDRDATGPFALVGIGDVKVVLEAALPVIPVVKNCDSLCAPIHPTPEPAVPSFDFKHRRCVRALGIDEDLLGEGQLIIAASGE